MLHEKKLPKPWMTITELAKHWGTDIETLLYRASIGELIVGVRDYGNSHSKPPPIGGEAPLDYEGDPLQCEFVGVLSLSANDIKHLASKGAALVEVALLHRAGRTETIILDEPLNVMVVDLVVPMVEIAKHDSQIAGDLTKSSGVLSEKKEETLLKQIGALALFIAKDTAYKYGENPNKLKIAEAAINAINQLPVKAKDNLYAYGLSPTNFRANITKGIDLLEGK